MPELVSRAFHRPSLFLRATLFVYLFLIIYASLYPFSGWRFSGVQPFSWLFAPFPRWWTWFDVLTNIAGYIPLGVLLATAVSPSLRGMRAFAFAVFTGVLLSFSMEVLQSCLPSRVPSNLDLLTNSAGTFIGAMLGALLSPVIFREDRLHYFIQRWLRFGSSRVLLVPMLWLFAQVYPQNHLFGHGQVLPLFSRWLTAYFMRPIDLAAMITGGMQLTAEQFWLSETIITATGLAGAILLLLYVFQRNAPGIRLAILMLFSALLFRTLSCALFFLPGNAFVWLTPGALGGLLVGILMLSGMVFTPPLIQRRMAIVMLLINLVCVNLLPDNQYFLSTLQGWSQGKFLNFNGAAYFFALAWPFLALWFLFRSIYKLRYSE